MTTRKNRYYFTSGFRQIRALGVAQIPRKVDIDPHETLLYQPKIPEFELPPTDIWKWEFRPEGWVLFSYHENNYFYMVLAFHNRNLPIRHFVLNLEKSWQGILITPWRIYTYRHTRRMVWKRIRTILQSRNISIREEHIKKKEKKEARLVMVDIRGLFLNEWGVYPHEWEDL